MSLDENKALTRRFIDAYNERNLTVFDELVAPDYVDHTHGQQGRESFKELFTLAFDAFPDWHEHIEDIIAEGDRVWVYVTATGTHTGEWNHFGVSFSPTGNRVRMRMVFIWRIEDGRIAEGWEVDEDLYFLEKLGAVEYTEQGKRLFSEDAGEGM